MSRQALAVPMNLVYNTMPGDMETCYKVMRTSASRPTVSSWSGPMKYRFTE